MVSIYSKFSLPGHLVPKHGVGELGVGGCLTVLR